MRPVQSKEQTATFKRGRREAPSTKKVWKYKAVTVTDLKTFGKNNSELTAAGKYFPIRIVDQTGSAH